MNELFSNTFTDQAAKFYKKAHEKNSAKSAFYFCATSKGITPRILDYASESAFCQKPRKKDTNKKYYEYKLQAFLVKSAMSNPEHLLPIPNKEWILLDAERRFDDSDLVGLAGEGKRFDLLAYEKASSRYIILELKVDRDLAKAKKELTRYTEVIDKYLTSANKFYSVENKIDAKNVKGYIVWPCCDNPKKNNTPWGLIEYDENLLSQIENIEFKIIE